MATFSLQRPGLALVLASTAILIIAVIYRGYRIRRFYRKLPGPPHSWLFGHIKAVGEITALLPPNPHPQLIYTEIVHRYNIKGIFYLDLWPIGPGFVTITDLKILEHSSPPKPLPVHPITAVHVEPMFGEKSIVTLNGSLWKGMSKILSPVFSASYIRGMTGIMVGECLQWRQKLDELATTGEPFSMEELVAKLAYGIVSTATLGHPQYPLTRGSQDLVDLRNLVDLARGESDISVAYNPMIQIPRRWRRRQIVERLESSLRKKIKERFDEIFEEAIVPSRLNPRSVLDLLLREHVEALVEKDDRTRNGRVRLGQIDEKRIFGNIRTFLLGGHSTATNTLSFLFMLLTTEPQVVAKMHEEHIEQLGNPPQVALLNDPDMFQKLPYTEAVLKEAMRLYPPGSDLKQAPPRTTVTAHDGSRFPIDNNLIVTINAHSIHYDSRIYPDPAAFRPERWLGTDRVDSKYLRPFGGEGRSCPGKNMAMNMLKMILVMTVGDYTFECADLKPNPEPRTTYTDLDLVFGDMAFQQLGLEGRPRDGMMMTVRKRV